jgi:threonylcarbamoyladenosine tRNA methylthiotransferase MtaB
MSVETLTFGCRLNAYESEVMKAEAEKAGLEGALIVNTCAVTAEAVRQAKQAIRKARRDDPARQIIVTGCAAQTEARTFSEMAEVDLVIGNADKMKAESYAPVAFGIKLNDKVQVNDIMARLCPSPEWLRSPLYVLHNSLWPRSIALRADGGSGRADEAARR